MLNQNKTHLLLVLFLLLYPFLWIWQGLDVTDTGFSMTNYALIFQHPASISYWGFNYWFTDILGGLWLSVTKGLGLFSIRLASAFIVILTTVFSYWTLYRIVSHTVLLIGLGLGEIFIERMYWLNYDNVSAFLYVMVSLFLARGIAKRAGWMLFTSGSILSFNLFARVTNIVGLLLILCIVLGGIFYRYSWRERFRQIGFFLAGILSTSILILFIMIQLHQFSLFVGNLLTLLHIASGHTNTHNGFSLLRQFEDDNTVVMWSILCIFFSVFLLFKITTVSKVHHVKLYIPITITFVLVCLSFVHIYMMNRYDVVATTTGVLYITLLSSSIFVEHKNPEYATLCTIAGIVLFVTPLGSNLGILLSVYGMYLALPLGLHFVWMEIPKWIHTQTNQPTYRLCSVEEWKFLCTFILILFSCNALVSNFFYTYRDASNRWSMRYEINFPALKFVYTTKARATVMSQLIAEIPKYVKPGTPLLSYEDTSLIYYLSGGIPYLHTSWPMLYDPVQLQEALQKVSSSATLPVVIAATGATANPNWPNVHSLRSDSIHIEDRQIINQFLLHYQYAVAWHNSFFEILIPIT